MTLGASLDGYLSIGGSGTAATGTLSQTGTATTYAGGTLAIDRSVFLAFYARVRLTRPDVSVGGERIPNVVDTVQLDSSLSEPINYAAFTLSTKRVAFFDVASLSRENLPVEIDFWAGPPGTVKQWVAFEGTTESEHNNQPYRPRGAYRAVSKSAEWANTKGCVNLPAFSGKTRGQILALFAESAGVTITNIDTVGGGVVNKPVDIAGITVFELIQRFGEVEGWYARATPDGEGLEVIYEDQMLEGPPIFVFDESNYFDVDETIPTRPVTNWVLSSTEIVGQDPEDDPEADDALVTETTTVSGVDADGNATLTVTEITKNQGVEVMRVVTEYNTVVVPGIELRPASFTATSRVTTQQDWAPFHYTDAANRPRTRPSTMLTRRFTRWEALSGVPYCVALADGTPVTGGSVWVQGGSFSTAYASFITVQTKEETFDWGDCFLNSAQTQVKAYYAPLEDVDSARRKYSDGSIRYGVSYLFQTVQESAITWKDFSNDNANPRVEQYSTVSKFYPVNPGKEVYGPFSRTTKTWDAGPNVTYALTESTSALDGSSSSDTSEAIPGTMPGVPSGSSAVPQFAQRVIMQNFDATLVSGFVKRTESPGAIDYAENQQELLAIAMRKIRRDCTLTIQISHNAVPFLREGDPIQLTNHARSLLGVAAYVSAISRSAQPINGAMRQTTTVKIPPDWI